jgi:hypothetical protein
MKRECCRCCLARDVERGLTLLLLLHPCTRDNIGNIHPARRYRADSRRLNWRTSQRIGAPRSTNPLDNDKDAL